MNIEYTVQIWREGNQFIAHATPIDVMSSGPSAEEAREALKEAVHLFLETLKEMGTLEEVLEECGYEPLGGNMIGPSWVAIEKQSLSIAV
ncbi:MAG: hypothetical protein JW821_00885 [Deltaproteobacteria bacterium]|nr:hypothetical protein [Deltaproteobacteria bacterium]